MSKVSVKGLVVLVTGANRKKGIGRALVEEAVRRGAKKVYATSRDPSQLDDLVEKYQGKVHALELDVTNPDQIQSVASKASDTQVLINNAGYSGGSLGYDEQSARLEMEVNFFGPVHLMYAFLNNLITNQNGAVVNVSSIAGLCPFPLAPTYSASKAALFSITQTARMELAERGIAVFGVYPGPIDTDMTESLKVSKDTAENAANRILDGMEEGIEDITTDSLADHFRNYLVPDPEAMKAVEKEFG